MSFALKILVDLHSLHSISSLLAGTSFTFRVGLCAIAMVEALAIQEPTPAVHQKYLGTIVIVTL